jgi:hypothetical protein
VLRYLEPGADTALQLFDDLVETLKRHALLPSITGHPAAYYELLAAWEFHTYALEVADYSPEIGFFAVPERGKSRTGRTLSYIARRGVHSETVREANLFRVSEHLGGTLFLDCKDLWGKAEKAGCEDIILHRFERGARVARVLFPDRGAFHDTKWYEIFGATILATNEPLGRILDTRCIPITMPLAPTGSKYPIPNETALRPVRERLTAWRARNLLDGWHPAHMAKPADSRLGDVLLPLAQLVQHIAPVRMPSFLALVKHLERGRRQERAMSWEAEVVAAVAGQKDAASNCLLLVDAVAAWVNKDRPEREQLSNKRISNVLRSLGFEMKKSHGNKAALVWDEEKVAALKEQYAPPPDESDEQPPGESDDTPHATHATPQGAPPETDMPPDAYSVDGDAIRDPDDAIHVPPGGAESVYSVGSVVEDTADGGFRSGSSSEWPGRSTMHCPKCYRPLLTEEVPEGVCHDCARQSAEAVDDDLPY